MSGESKHAAARQRIAAKRAAEAAARAAAERRRRTLLGGVVAGIVLIVVLVAVVVVQTRRTSTPADAAAPANRVDNGYVFALGSTDAPVTVDLYEDFQCPNCKALEDSTGNTINGLLAAGTVQVHYHGMAFLNTDENGQYATRALNAAAVVANAAGTDAYKTFHDLLFAHQPDEGGSGLTDDQLIDDAAQAGAGGAAVEQGIRDLVYGDWVTQAEEQASKDGVTGTPTLFVDGTRLDPARLTADGITAAVTAAQQ
jgi:protein-disulfide isomerase